MTSSCASAILIVFASQSETYRKRLPVEALLGFADKRPMGEYRLPHPLGRGRAEPEIGLDGRTP